MQDFLAHGAEVETLFDIIVSRIYLTEGCCVYWLSMACVTHMEKNSSS